MEKNLNLPEAETVIDNSFYTATLSESGNWIYKAKNIPIPIDGKYKDVPRYPMIYQYENKFKNNYTQELQSMVLDIGKKLLEFHKKQQHSK